MHIHDFHSRLTSTNEESRLFQALRALSRVEDPESILGGDRTLMLGEWAAWPALETSPDEMAAGAF
jgi:hypothetical protein